jgi:hypothetical protein
MEIKKLVLLLGIILAIGVPWYINYVSYFFKKNKCNKDDALIEMNDNINELNICNNKEFDLLIEILSQHLPDLKFIHLLPQEEQQKIYSKLLENYVIDAYVVKEYLNQNYINSNEEFIKSLDLYLKIMENNFNMNVFQKNIANEIKIDDQIAKKYYEDNKNTIFANNPFTKIAPGINANAVIIDDESKNNKIYEQMLLDKKNCIPIENYNPQLVSVSDSSFADALINMKLKEYRTITMQNGQKIMLYKISDNKGDWFPYEEVSEQVKRILKTKLTQENSIEKITDLKKQLNIKVSQKNLNQYIHAKNILLKNQDSITSSIENKILNNVSDFDLQGDEFIEPQVIKDVQQEVAK